jgi:molecular chaperone GrpE
MSNVNGPNDHPPPSDAVAGDVRATGSAADAGGQQPMTADEAALEADLHKLQQERDALFEQVARVQADFRNAQKRLEQEKLTAIQYANARLVKALLPVLDNFERALEVDPARADAASILKGLGIVHDQLVKVLQENHVQVIAPAPGTPFDPNQHEALMQQPDDRYSEPTVTQLLQKGYSMHGRLLRPAQVAVSKT